MAKTTDYINLLRRQEKPFIDRFLDWAFTVGRGIVIITETIALSAFAYRFVLDRQIIDLRDKIKQETAILKISQNTEHTFRNLQKKLTSARELNERSNTALILLDEIVKNAQGKVAFYNISIDQSGIGMDGVIASPDAASTFVSSLEEHPLIAKASIGTIHNDPATGITTASFLAELRQHSKEIGKTNL